MIPLRDIGRMHTDATQDAPALLPAAYQSSVRNNQSSNGALAPRVSVVTTAAAAALHTQDLDWDKNPQRRKTYLDPG